MKVLLDENLPKKLKRDLLPHEVATVRDMGWLGIKNGALLKLLTESKFDVLITRDKSLPYQQNLAKYPIFVIVLRVPDSHYSNLERLLPQLRNLLRRPQRPGLISIDNS